MSETPELDKMVAAQEASQAIGAFMEWLAERVVFAEPHTHNDDCYMSDEEMRASNTPQRLVGWDMSKICPANEGQLVHANIGTIEEVLAQYFDIDLQQVAKEQEKVLTNIRELREATA